VARRAGLRVVALRGIVLRIESLLITGSHSKPSWINVFSDYARR
jgi:hypothetical protein